MVVEKGWGRGCFVYKCGEVINMEILIKWVKFLWGVLMIIVLLWCLWEWVY